MISGKLNVKRFLDGSLVRLILTGFTYSMG